MLRRHMRRVERCARLLVLVAWMALITFWSAQGNLPIDQPSVANQLHGFQHRIAHLLAYGLLAVLARWAFDGLPRASLWAIVLTSAFGASDEWHQQFTPGRRAALDDWALDTAAGTLALYVIARLRATSWNACVRSLAPVAVAAAFVLGIGLAARPGLPSELRTTSFRTAAHSAIQLVRDTRDAARQFRSSVMG
jgi:VanZ family protein